MHAMSQGTRTRYAFAPYMHIHRLLLSITTSEIRSGVVLFTGSRDGASNKALSALDKIGCSYKVVQVDKEADGAEIRAELKKRTGITTLPFIFIKGQYVGGMSSGGPAGGLNGLMKGDMLQPMLEAAGAVKRSRLDSTPLAPLRGNNLRNALGSLGGGANPFGAPDQRR